MKIATASGVAWWIGNLAGQSRPVFAAIVPLLVIRDDTTATLHGSLGRVVGVLAGVGLGIGALAVVNPSAVAVAVVMAIALAIDQGPVRCLVSGSTRGTRPRCRRCSCSS